MVNGVKPNLESGVEVVHAISGRVRLRILDSSLMALILPLIKQLQQQQGVKEIRVNERTGSLIIAFDPDWLSQPHVIQMLEHLGIERALKKARETNAIASRSDIYSRVSSSAISFIPPIVGILATRWLAVSGWRAILTYLIATELTRQGMKQLKPECLEKLESDRAI